jgi:protein gp37
MAKNTPIEWTDHSWPVLNGCRRKSEGCRNCYAERLISTRLRNMPKYKGLAVYSEGGPRWTGASRLWVPDLVMPLKLRKPSKIFVADMGDLFFEENSFEDIAAIFGVMAACPQHTFQVLTKRPERAAEWFALPDIARLVDTFKHMALWGRLEEFFALERIVPVPDWPGYLVTSKGRVLSERGSARCLWCRGPNGHGIAKKMFCSKQCKNRADYESSLGRWSAPAVEPREMRADTGDHGHRRVTMYRNGGSERLLIHRLVLKTFDREALADEQACHINGDANQNALWNLRWGDGISNYADSRRHGTSRRYQKLSETQVQEIRRRHAAGETDAAALGREYRVSDTQIGNIVRRRQWVQPDLVWPLPNLALGCSAEDQDTYNERVPKLVHRCPAAVHWVSIEPQLGPIKLRGTGHIHIGWVVQGGESGPGARPFDLEWARSMRDECVENGIPYFFKQWGAFAPAAGGSEMVKLGKKKAGRLLDGREWNEFPEIRT